MNIADIRKKAQQEKECSPRPVQKGAVSTENVLLPETVQEMETFVVPHTDQADGMSEYMSDCVAECMSDCAQFPASEVEPKPAEVFDPLAIILEGREIAACVDETLLVVSAGPVSDGSEFQEILCFRVSSEEYALNIMDIKEIIKPREITEVPRVPAFVRGVLSLRGIIIPVFDMRIRLGLADGGTTSEKNRIIVVKKADSYCGVLVDEVIQVVRIASQTIEPPPAVLEGIDRDFVNGIGRYDGRMLILLNMENILDVTLV